MYGRRTFAYALLRPSEVDSVTVAKTLKLPPASCWIDRDETTAELDELPPFYIDERLERIDIVRSSLSNPKITASEQVRQILEAYNIEAEYGRKISSYEDTIVIDGKEMVVNILVVGRIGMFYQTKDEQQSGFWNNETNDWEEVSGYRTAIRDGIRMAKKLAPTDMLLLPVVKGGAR